MPFQINQHLHVLKISLGMEPNFIKIQIQKEHWPTKMDLLKKFSMQFTWQPRNHFPTDLHATFGFKRAFTLFQLRKAQMIQKGFAQKDDSHEQFMVDIGQDFRPPIKKVYETFKHHTEVQSYGVEP